MSEDRRDNRGRQPKRLPANDPCHPRGTPEPPGFLGGDALSEWHRVVPVLEEIGKLTEADRSILAGYCVACAQYDRLQHEIDQLDSLVVESTRGRPCLHPAIQGRDRALAQMLECSKRLGLSPYDRERMKPPVVQSERDAEMDVLEHAKLRHKPYSHSE